MMTRGASCAALLAMLALPSAARAWGPTTPVQTPPASEPEAAAPQSPATPDTGAPPPAPEAPPLVEAPAPVAPPPPPPPPPAPEEPLAPPPFGPPEETPVVAVAGHAPIARPRLSAAVGMGVTFDSAGQADGRHTIPAFFGVLGIGDGLLLGFDLGAFASQASGRSGPTQAPIDRLALDGFGVLRPGARFQPDDQSYQMRVVHALAFELGLGFERDGRSAISGTRFTVHTGARVDLPLAPAGEASDLRLRFAVRRDIGLYTPRLRSTTSADVTSVEDSAAELYAALVVVF
jgi:hypothetical protein